MRNSSLNHISSAAWLATLVLGLGLGFGLGAGASVLAAEDVAARVVGVTPDGQVTLALPVGAVVAVGDPVRIGAEISGVGKVDIATPWRIEAVSDTEARALPEGTPAAMPQAGYLATIATEMAQGPVASEIEAETPAGDLAADSASEDPSEMFAVALRSAQAGSGPDMLGLAFMYLDGWGTPPDPAEAWRWAEAALAAGERDAHGVLGQMLLEGTAPVADPAGAARHLFEAFEDGSQEMASHAATLIVMLGPEAPPAFAEEVQRILGDIGVYEGPVDGDFGPETLEAIEMLRMERFGSP